MQLQFLYSIILYFCVFLAGFVDSVAGGGGLISLPAYFFVNIPTHFALGCNKFSAACGTTFSALRFFKNGAVDCKPAIVSAFFSFISSFIGMKIALMIDQELLKKGFMVLLPIIAVLLLIKRNFGNEDKSSEVPKKKLFILAVFTGTIVGFYDGLIGPGTGTIAIIAFSLTMKYGLKTASGNAKILNLASNYASLIAVVIEGKVIYSIAIPCAFFGILGNYLGSGFAIKKGASFIRPIMIVVIILLFAKIFYDMFGSIFF